MAASAQRTLHLAYIFWRTVSNFRWTANTQISSVWWAVFLLFYFKLIQHFTFRYSSICISLIVWDLKTMKLTNASAATQKFAFLRVLTHHYWHFKRALNFRTQPVCGVVNFLLIIKKTRLLEMVSRYWLCIKKAYIASFPPPVTLVWNLPTCLVYVVTQHINNLFLSTMNRT